MYIYFKENDLMSIFTPEMLKKFKASNKKIGITDDGSYVFQGPRNGTFFFSMNLSKCSIKNFSKI